MVITLELPDSDFVSKCIGQAYSTLCALPDYIAAHDFPRLPTKLSTHRCLRLVNSVISPDRWLFDGSDGQELAYINQTHFQVSTADAMTEAAVSGIGAGALPVYMAINGLKDGNLVWVLPRYSPLHLNVYALYPSQQCLGAKIRTQVEFLREHTPTMFAAGECSLAESGGLAN